MFMDYGLMWGELRAQMEELQEKKDSIDIEVLLSVCGMSRSEWTIARLDSCMLRNSLRNYSRLRNKLLKTS